MGHNAFNELRNEEKEMVILYDTKIYIKGFDLFELKKFFPPNINMTTYEFNIADVIITKQSLVLLGKIDWYGGLWYDAPIEITTGNAKTSLIKVKAINLIIKNKKFEVEIVDPNFKKPFRIEFKEGCEKFNLWLNENAIPEQQAERINNSKIS